MKTMLHSWIVSSVAFTRERMASTLEGEQFPVLKVVSSGSVLLAGEKGEEGDHMKQRRHMKRRRRSLLTPNPKMLLWDEPLTEDDVKNMPDAAKGLYNLATSLNPGIKRLKTGWLKVPVPNDVHAFKGEFEEEVPFACLRITAIPALTQPAKQGAMLMHCGGPGTDATCPLAIGLGLALNRSYLVGDPVANDFDLIGISQRGVDQFLNSGTLGPLVGPIWGARSGPECPFKGAQIWPQMLNDGGIKKLINERGVEEVLQRLDGKPDMAEWNETISKVWDGKPGHNFGAPSLNETYVRWAYRLLHLEANLVYKSDQFQMTSKVGRSFNMLDHVSTSDLAYDIQRLRRAVGVKKISIYGESYGTSVGSAYATLFPKNVNKLVLDGNLDPMPEAMIFDNGFAEGRAATWSGLAFACDNSVAQHVDEEDRCPAGPGVDRKLRQLMLDPSVNQTKAIAVTNAWANTVKADDVPCAAALMRCIADMDEGKDDLSSCFFVSSLGGLCHAQEVTELDWPASCLNGACYSGFVSVGAIWGLDYPGRMLEEEYIAKWRTRVADSPLLAFTQSMGSSILPAVWPALPRPLPPLGDAALTPLIIGNLHDADTSYKNSQRTSVAFPSGKLLTWQGYGHTLTTGVTLAVIGKDGFMFEKQAEKDELMSYDSEVGKMFCYKHVLEYLKFGKMPRDYVCKTGDPAMTGPGPVAEPDNGAKL